MAAAGKSIGIPAILKVGRGALDNIGIYLKEENFQNAVLYFGNGLIELFGMKVMDSLKEAGIEVLEYREIDTVCIDDIVEMAFTLPNKVQTIIAVGGGKVIDAGKYAAFLRNLPFISVPTSSSSDGFSSASASLVVEGRRTSVPARLAHGIIVDTEVIRTAPERFIYSGIGDMVSKITALYDWLFEARAGYSQVNDFAVMIAKKAVNSFVRTPFQSIQEELFLKELLDSLAMSGIGILTSWMPMVFAIFLCEMKNLRFRRFVQTFTTVPNFISWVLVYAIAFCIFSTDGFLSSMFVNMGIWDEGRNLLMNGDHMWIKMWAWGTWKGIGWSAIIYIAAISGIDQQLYEAATVDGAGRFQRMWHITVPGLLPTFFVLLLMSVANILSNGMEQYLVFENATNTSSIMVLDLYVYKLGIGKGSIPLTTAVGMLKSVISVILLFGANGISKLLRGESII